MSDDEEGLQVWFRILRNAEALDAAAEDGIANNGETVAPPVVTSNSDRIRTVAELRENKD